MNLLQLNNCFYFNHYLSVNNKIRPSCAHMNAFVIDWHILLSQELNSRSFQLNCQTTLINDFLKTIAQSLVHFHVLIICFLSAT